MKYYKSPNNEIFAFEADGSQDHLIWKNFTSITEEEAKATAKAKEEALLKEWLAKQPNKEEQIAQLQAQIDALKA
jgi:transposase